MATANPPCLPASFLADPLGSKALVGGAIRPDKPTGIAASALKKDAKAPDQAVFEKQLATVGYSTPADFSVS